MSNSKFGMPMPIQQPPPICKKGPENLPLPPPGPPHDMQAAVTFTPDPSTVMEPGYSATVDISLGNPTKVYKGTQQAGAVTAHVKMQMFTEIKTWDAEVKFDLPHGVSATASFGVRAYQDDPLLVFPLAKAFTFPVVGLATLKVMP